MNQMIKLDQICKIQSGGTPRRGIDKYYGGNIPWAKIGDIENATNGYLYDTAELITEEGLRSINNRLFPKNTVLLAMYGSVGKTAITAREMSTNQAILGLQPIDSKILNIKFLKYWLDYSKSSFIKQARGVALQNISATIVKESVIPLPSKEEQNKIVELLDQADSLRQKRKQAIDLLNEYLKSMFLDMFGDPVSNPKNWDMKPLSELLTKPTQNGLYVPKENYHSEGTEMVHMSDFFSGIVKRGNLKRVKISQKDIDKYRVEPSDILIARRSLTYSGSAKPCLIPQSSEALVFESSLIKVSPNPNILLPVYLYSYLANDRVRNFHVLKYVTSSTISGINQSGLNKILILLPPLKLQEHFVSRVKSTQSLKETMLKQLEELDNQFHSIIQDFFSLNLQ